MSGKYAIALHDVRVSGGTKSIELIQSVLELFQDPLTIHLIFDRPLDENPILLQFILEKVKENDLEIVFHGLTHQCPEEISKFMAFYHKHQAEYLNNSSELKTNTTLVYKSAKEIISKNIGICPPCWMATKENYNFFQNLNPGYIERLTSLSDKSRKVFSPVISLGSPNNFELFFLKALASIIKTIVISSRNVSLRVAIHVCDIEKRTSLEYFSRIVQSLKKHHFLATLQKELIS